MKKGGKKSLQANNLANCQVNKLFSSVANETIKFTQFI